MQVHDSELKRHDLKHFCVGSRVFEWHGYNKVFELSKIRRKISSAIDRCPKKGAIRMESHNNIRRYNVYILCISCDFNNFLPKVYLVVFATFD